MKTNTAAQTSQARGWFGKTIPVCWILLAGSGVLGLPVAGFAGSNQLAKSPADLENLTLEQLVNVQVTSVSKKETGLFTAPAAIYVISQEDIHRSGMSTIPELLRMVPGLEVARVDANHWAISARGFNDQYANKLLVLVDGRSVYSPAFGGVFWNVQDLPLDDIERIEVIRGPGAALWGANAVNGVINIISKNAKDTQGGLATVTYGTENQPVTTVRYGGQLATNLFYRVYVKYFNRDHFSTTTGQDAGDGWDAVRSGFRMDWSPTVENNFTLQGDYYTMNAGEMVDETTLTPPYANRMNLTDYDTGENVLGRWTHKFSDTSQLNVQMYYDHSEQGDSSVVIKNDTFDFDLQHRFGLGTRQDIVWGGGYRYLATQTSQDFYVALIPPDDYQQLLSAFVQNDITVVRDRLHLTVGSKFEQNDITGFDVQPSVRLAWTPTEHQTVWAAVSRAVRTPSNLERNIQLNYAASQPPVGPPVLVAFYGNPNLESEVLTAYELGYRIKPIERLSFDLAVFYNDYDQLITPVQGTPYFEPTPTPGHLVVPSVYQNSSSVQQTYGGELLGEWSATDRLKLTASYTFIQTHLTPNVTVDSNPQNQFQLHSYLNLPQHIGLDAAVYYVDQITAPLGTGSVRIPSYVRVDLGATWRPTKSLELGVYGQNLLDGSHVEFTSYKTTAITEIPRSVMGRITWRF